MKKKILFRADGNAQTGLGHLYRIFALVEMYENYFEFVFVTKENTTLEVIPKTYSIQLIPSSISIEEEPKWLSANFDVNEFIIIADGYQFVSSYQKKIKELGYNLVYIDDLVTEYMYADVVINHSLEISKKDYKTEKYTQIYLGTNYAILRPLFLEAASKSKTIEKIDTAFVCFGGADMYNLSLKSVKALLDFYTIKKINVVLGAAYKNEELSILAKTNKNISVFKNVSEKEMLHIMQSSNFAIAPSSTILYELCCVKMPILSGYYVANQKLIYKGLANKKVIIGGGNFTKYTTLDFKNKIELIIKNNSIDNYIINQKKLFKGYTKPRFLGIVNRSLVTFRKAINDDMMLVYNWSNDSLVRRQSYNSNLIELEDHKEWFTKKIKDKNTLFLIILINNTPAGIVRFDCNNDDTIIGLLLDKKYRGQKLASTILIEVGKYYFKTYKNPIFAYIKKTNTPSIKAFEKANYIFVKKEKIRGVDSFLYKLIQ